MPRATNENLDATVKFLSAPLALLLLEIRVLAQAEACTSCKVNMPPTLPKLHAPCTRELTAAGRMHVLPKIIRQGHLYPRWCIRKAPMGSWTYAAAMGTCRSLCEPPPKNTATQPGSTKIYHRHCQSQRTRSSKVAAGGGAG
jgi:hypothetical protein